MGPPSPVASQWDLPGHHSTALLAAITFHFTNLSNYGEKLSPGNAEVSRETCARKNTVKIKATSMGYWQCLANVASEGPVLEAAQHTHLSGFQLHKG